MVNTFNNGAQLVWDNVLYNINFWNTVRYIKYNVIYLTNGAQYIKFEQLAH